MEQNNPKLPPTTFCRSGCGFYGNDSFEGLCSKCYKDQIKRKQSSSPVGSSAGRVSPVGSSQGEREVINSVSQTLAKTNLGPVTETSTASSSVSSASSSTSTTPSVETATPTIQVPNIDKDKEEGATGGVDTSDTTESSVDAAKDKKKKNRCHTCKKKVGLTGFECRCGGLYCSLHRYSDKHDCTFNYKELAQQQIRKNNPVIVGEKVKKI